MLCINFYSYLFARTILSGKLNILYKWKNNLINDGKTNDITKRKLINVLLFNKKNSDQIKTKLLDLGILNNIVNKPVLPTHTLSNDQKIISDPIKKMTYSSWSRKVMFPLVGFEHEHRTPFINSSKNK